MNANLLFRKKTHSNEGLVGLKAAQTIASILLTEFYGTAEASRQGSTDTGKPIHWVDKKCILQRVLKQKFFVVVIPSLPIALAKHTLRVTVKLSL